MSYECTPHRCKRRINLLTTASEKDTSQWHDGTQTVGWRTQTLRRIHLTVQLHVKPESYFTKHPQSLVQPDMSEKMSCFCSNL